MNYAYTFAGHGTFTPEGRADGIDVDAHNRACTDAEMAQIKAGSPTVVYPKMDPDRNMINRRYYGLAPGIVTLWGGQFAGHVVSESTFRNPFGGTLTAYTWRDLTGKLWYGRGSGDGMALISRRRKA